MSSQKFRYANQTMTKTRDMNGRSHDGIWKLVRIFAKLFRCSHVLTSRCGIVCHERFR